MIPAGAEPGRPIAVLAGGVGVPRDEWAPLTEALDAAGMPHVLVERPGTSWLPAWDGGEGPTLESEAARIAGACRRARDEGAASVVLVAHSAAGFFAEAAVLEEPGLADGVVLLDVSATSAALPAFPGLVAPSRWLAAATAPLVRRLRGDAAAGRWRTLLLENALFRYWARDLRALRRDRGERDDAAGAPAVPRALVLTAYPKAPAVLAALPFGAALWDLAWRLGWSGHADGIARRWAELAGDCAEVELRDCGHMVMGEKPAAVAASIRGLARAAG
ncbi:alpha/beta fold hydrolase [Corynebacterium sp. 335C]